MGVEQYQSRWAYARCAGLSQQESDRIFFPRAGRPKKVMPYEEYCNTCPIRNFCLSYALVHDEEGVWGGMTKNQRDSLLLMSPKVKDQLIEEAKIQGWYEERRSIDEILSPVPEPQEEYFEILIPNLPESVFDFAAPEYTQQTQSEPYKPADLLPLEAPLGDSDNDQYEDSSESLFGFPSPFHDKHSSNKQLIHS